MRKKERDEKETTRVFMRKRERLMKKISKRKEGKKDIDGTGRKGKMVKIDQETELISYIFIITRFFSTTTSLINHT